jgi:L-aminopeptidase/D-esterase-like protein
VPGAASPFIDQWAPAQYVYGSSGGAGPVRSPDTGAYAAVNVDAGGYGMNSDSTYDPQITWKIAGTIVLALVTVFVLQASGFRFVGAVGVGAR